MAVGLAGQMVLAPFYGLYQAWLSAQRHTWNTPRHIGIIMDGNRRFARARRMLSPMEGHRKGADKLDEVLNWLEEAGVKVVSVWIFSMDNFKRDPSEVEALMDLFQRKFTELVSQPRIHANEIRVRFLGKVEALPENVRQAIAQAEDATRHYTRRTLNVGVAYGGREEIVDAFRAYLSGREKDGASLEQIQRELTPASIEPYLYTSGMPDPDLIIRTSGEVRLSGFLLWQSVYSEFYFCDTNWPAFRKIDLLRALREYHRRQRRFGR
ncbi:MAG: polyprenyl diphosphate synthase [Deltaproteobacteria bacterium]|nr:polyprenyl diphosphate synthase [Deltaproteobacteria bacterium]